jgi:hypothetical protein
MQQHYCGTQALCSARLVFVIAVTASFDACYQAVAIAVLSVMSVVDARVVAYQYTPSTVHARSRYFQHGIECSLIQVCCTTS